MAAIGAGGMGEVYKARDNRLERIVAIKVLPAWAAADPEARARFEREAKTISQLNHPNICILHDIGESAPGPESHGAPVHYLVMEYLEGESLAARSTRGPVPVDERSGTPWRLPTRSTRRTARGDCAPRSEAGERDAGEGRRHDHA